VAASAVAVAVALVVWKTCAPTDKRSTNVSSLGWHQENAHPARHPRHRCRYGGDTHAEQDTFTNQRDDWTQLSSGVEFITAVGRLGIREHPSSDGPFVELEAADEYTEQEGSTL